MTVRAKSDGSAMNLGIRSVLEPKREFQFSDAALGSASRADWGAVTENLSGRAIRDACVAGSMPARGFAIMGSASVTVAPPDVDRASGNRSPRAESDRRVTAQPNGARRLSDRCANSPERVGNRLAALCVPRT